MRLQLCSIVLFDQSRKTGVNQSQPGRNPPQRQRGIGIGPPGAHLLQGVCRKSR